KRFAGVVPRNAEVVSDLLDVVRLQTHDVSSTFWPHAFAKNRRADAHQRRALLDRDWEIIRHTNRKMGKRYIKLLFERVTQIGQSHKEFVRCFCFLRKLWDRHPSLDCKTRTCEQQF